MTNGDNNYHSYFFIIKTKQKSKFKKYKNNYNNKTKFVHRAVHKKHIWGRSISCYSSIVLEEEAHFASVFWQRSQRGSQE